MPVHLPAPVRGALSLIMYALNTVLCGTSLVLLALVKMLLPNESMYGPIDVVMNRIAMAWVLINRWNMQLTKDIHWDVRGLEGLDPDGWYLVVSNHQTWLDIPVLQDVFYGKVPPLKFITKQELLWAPFLGQALWALDFPFMKRYSKAFLEKNPHLRGRDVETLKKSCRRLRRRPSAIVNFVEGTRFTPLKRDAQHSPYRRLLKPKAGGIALVLSSMNHRLNSILNVTIVYPEGVRSFWSFMRGEVKDIRVVVEELPVGEELIGDYDRDEEFKERIREWLGKLWEEKDRRIEDILRGAADEKSGSRNEDRNTRTES